jgi:molybdopterin synthase sulfur carrier subunit
MGVIVRIPSPLRKITNGADKVAIDADNIQSCVDVLEDKFPGIKERLLDESGEIRYFVNFYVNGEDVRFLQSLETTLKDGDEISIVPAVAGG